MPGDRRLPPSKLSINVGALLDNARTEQFLLQRDLAEHIGVSQSQMSKFLRGERALNLDQLDALCRKLGLSIVGIVSDALAN
ncbi:helix-turn-helix domain-containing protein [Humibacter sp.]|uniref:helix-turn-helix domain-containing protein n=1 Tax=Humibacter sp. TaxID=1940291 RepID=UPI003F7F0B80